MAKIFDGFDFTELYTVWNLELCPDEEIAEDDPENLIDYPAKAIQEYLDWVLKISMGGLRNTGYGPQRILQETAFDLRLFLIALADDLDSGWGYHGPVFRGLSQVEDDWSMIQMAVGLIPSMWS